MAKEIKKIGHNINLKNIVIHQVVKEQGTRTDLKIADKLLDISEKETMFVGQINKVYHQKSNPIYGIFGNEDETFKNLIKKYQNDNDFYLFSIDALKHYEKKLKTEPASTGGFLIFAHFVNTDNNKENLLVLTANNKNGYVVNDNLTINDSKSLELNKIDVACIIDISKWQRIEAGIDKESKTYLSFVKGNKDISYYFMAFIDCDNKQTGSEASQRLVKAIDEFCKQKGYDRTTKVSKERDVYSYCEECMNNKREIQLSRVSSLLEPENPNEFQEFASDETYGVSAVISGDKSKIKYIKYTMFRNKDIVIEFDKKLLGKDVIYNSQKNELTFKNLPEELINQIPT
jgi:nucleoid-associated protein YejK